MKKSINSQIKTFLNKYDMIDLKIIHMDEKSIEFSTKGGAKPMVERGFNQKQIQQIASIVSSIIDEKVPGIVKNIVEPEFKKINDRLDKVEQRLDKVEQRLDNLEKRVDKIEQRLDNLEQDVKAIKSCPTIQKELSLVQ